jgi:hypothetical protein
MAMATYLQMVSADELAELERNPGGINQLDQRVWTQTYLAFVINYFLTGDAYPTDHPLASMLGGSRSINTPTLENGSFGITEASEVAGIVVTLEAVDRAAVKAAVEAADFDELVADEELYELEVMDPDAVPGDVINDLEELLGFYKKVAAAGGAVVSYTT